MDEIEIELKDILAEMDELGRAKFDAAHQRAMNKKLAARIAELENDSGSR